jgi:mycothiol system anti-sigma-R factor
MSGEQFGDASEPDGGQPDAEDAETVCTFVIAEVWTFLDGECCEETCAELLRHLQTCRGCRRRYALEARIKRLIATKCGGDKAPAWLRWTV